MVEAERPGGAATPPVRSADDRGSLVPGLWGSTITVADRARLGSRPAAGGVPAAALRRLRNGGHRLGLPAVASRESALSAVSARRPLPARRLPIREPPYVQTGPPAA